MNKLLLEKQQFIKNVMGEEPIQDKEFVDYEKDPDLIKEEKKFKQI